MKEEKTRRLEFRLTENDYQIIEKNYQKSIYPTKSEFMRETLINSEIKNFDYKFINLYIFQIKKIGNNINQLVKKLNTYNFINRDEINFIIKSMEEIKIKQEKLEEEIKEITNGIL